MVLANPCCSCATANCGWIRQARRVRSTCAQVRLHGAQLHPRRKLLRSEARRELPRWQAHPGQRAGDRCTRARLHAKLTPSAHPSTFPASRILTLILRAARARLTAACAAKYHSYLAEYRQMSCWLVCAHPCNVLKPSMQQKYIMLQQKRVLISSACCAQGLSCQSGRRSLM